MTMNALFCVTLHNSDEERHDLFIFVQFHKKEFSKFHSIIYLFQIQEMS